VEVDAMTMKFAYRWNWDYDKKDWMAFDTDDARQLVYFATKDNGGAGLVNEIDNGLARVISAPHRTSGGDTRRHLTVHCRDLRRTYHIYISRNDNFSGMDYEAVSGINPKTGHVNDDRKAPVINDMTELW
jgi:hypothetical protein